MPTERRSRVHGLSRRHAPRMQEQTTLLTVVEGGSFVMWTLAYDMGASFSISKLDVDTVTPQTETK
eukprot:5136336-Amphidinium_carterae.1